MENVTYLAGTPELRTDNVRLLTQYHRQPIESRDASWITRPHLAFKIFLENSLSPSILSTSS